MESVTLSPQGQPIEMQLNVHNIARVHLDPAYRKQSGDNIRSMVKTLEAGKTFNTIFVMVKTPEGWTCIEGNHRIVAIQTYLRRNPDSTVIIRAIEFPEGTSHQELFQEFNNGKKQSLHDVMRHARSQLPFLERLKQERVQVHVGIYSPVKAGDLVQAHMASELRPAFTGGRFDKFDIRDYAISMDEESYQCIKQFLVAFHEGLRQYMSGDSYPFMATTPFYALYRVYYDNRERVEPQDMVEAFSYLGGMAEDLHEAIKHGGTSNQKATRDLFVRKLNERQSDVVFVKDPEAKVKKEVELEVVV